MLFAESKMESLNPAIITLSSASPEPVQGAANDDGDKGEAAQGYDQPVQGADKLFKNAAIMEFKEGVP